MMQWETLILQTVQLGGSLVFLSDNAPADFEEWLKPLRSNFFGKVSFVVRSQADLLNRLFSTKSQDLVLIFESQRELLYVLNPVLAGQRMLLSRAASARDPWIDVVWPNASSAAWSAALNNLSVNWDKTKPLEDFENVYTAPCLFLDRDDVVVKNVPYNKDPEQVELMPGIEELIAEAHKKGYWVAMVTNQSGLGRGWIPWPQYQAVHQRMLKMLAEKGCWLDECVWASYYENGIPVGERFASLRKPRNGMFQLVEEKLKPSMTKSVMLGDSATDLIAAFASGVGNLFLLSSIKLDSEKEVLVEFQKHFPDFRFKVANSFSEVKL